jgi:hypothetical protein
MPEGAEKTEYSHATAPADLEKQMTIIAEKPPGVCEITIQHTWNDYAMLRRIVSRTNYKGSWPLYIASCTVAFILTLAVNSDSGLSEKVWFKLGVNLTIIFCLTKWFYHVLWQRANGAKAADDVSLSTKRFKIQPEGIKQEGRNLSTTANWSAIWKLQQTKEYMLFYTSKDGAFVVPKRDFGDDHKARAFWELAQKYWNDSHRDVGAVEQLGERAGQ